MIRAYRVFDHHAQTPVLIVVKKCAGSIRISAVVANQPQGD
jgi:hypothetical protein